MKTKYPRLAAVTQALRFVFGHSSNCIQHIRHVSKLSVDNDLYLYRAKSACYRRGAVAWPNRCDEEKSLAILNAVCLWRAHGCSCEQDFCFDPASEVTPDSLFPPRIKIGKLYRFPPEELSKRRLIARAAKSWVDNDIDISYQEYMSKLGF